MVAQHVKYSPPHLHRVGLYLLVPSPLTDSVLLGLKSSASLVRSAQLGSARLHSGAAGAPTCSSMSATPLIFLFGPRSLSDMLILYLFEDTQTE